MHELDMSFLLPTPEVQPLSIEVGTDPQLRRFQDTCPSFTRLECCQGVASGVCVWETRRCMENRVTVKAIGTTLEKREWRWKWGHEEGLESRFTGFPVQAT